MRQSVLDEREHRRGLVLGLTLAEVLLLLLFLLLLVLGARMERIEREKAESENQRARLEKAFALLEPSSSSDDRAVPIQELVGSLIQTSEKQADLIDQAESKLSELENELAALRPAVQAASKINPNDPPAVLVRAVEVLNKLGPLTQPDDVEPLSGLEPNTLASPKASERAAKGKHDWPPIITLSEARGHYFETGSAELSPELESTLTTTVVDQLLQIVQAYDVNVVEVIGHTDEQPVVERPSNLDGSLMSFLRNTEAEPLIPADNAGLGLARAVSVVRVLSKDERLRHLRILPLSGAQLIDVGDKLSTGTSSGSVKERRRIEIRVRRSDEFLGQDKKADTSVDATSSTTAPTLTGPASVIDGDTIEIDSTRIRLWGIDAIEIGQDCSIQGVSWDCAKESTAALAAHIAGHDVSCVPKGRDRYDRLIATCRANDVDVGAWLVRQGLALDYPDYSKKAYAVEQALAKQERRGLWRSDFVPPWIWRQQRASQE